MKIIALLRFDSGCSIDWSGLASASRGDGRPPRLLRVIESPVGAMYRPPSNPDPIANSELYDAAAIWDDTDALPDFESIAHVRDVHAWQVEANQRFHREPYGQDEEAITLLGRLMFHADLPDSAARRSWAHHAPLAERVHVGASRYIQNWVVGALTPECPPTRGLPELRFPSSRALIAGFFDSDRGRDEIVQDVSHFVSSGPRLFLAHASDQR